MGVASFYIVPESKWLSNRSIAQVLDYTEGKIDYKPQSAGAKVVPVEGAAEKSE